MTSLNDDGDSQKVRSIGVEIEVEEIIEMTSEEEDECDKFIPKMSSSKKCIGSEVHSNLEFFVNFQQRDSMVKKKKDHLKSFEKCMTKKFRTSMVNQARMN